MKVWWSVVATSPPPRLYFCLQEGQDRISFHILVARGVVSSVDLGGNFKTIFWPDPILQVRLHPGIWCFYPSHLSDCQNFDLFVFRSWWLPGNLGTEHARKSIMSERLYLAGGVKWGKILLIIGLNESFELYLGLARQGQVSSYVTSRAIRDLLSYLPVRADTILDMLVCACVPGSECLLTLCCISILTRHVWTWPAGSISGRDERYSNYLLNILFTVNNKTIPELRYKFYFSL